MTTLKFVSYPIPSADMGKDSCLPDIHVNSYIRAPITVGDNVNKQDGEHIGKGMISTLLPYRIEDGYNRERKTREFKAAVLENEKIKAVFLPELGGRLWSLIDKKSGKELLYKNDVFQPCNLALRNAWFSGGVEWNLGIKGHNPLTCSPLFCKSETNTSGEPVLKMYEYERIREVAYCIEATLQEENLLVKITIENTSDEDKYMYWWSNIAVPETPKTRVIVPANEMFLCSYSDKGYYVDKSPLPYVGGKDISYSSNVARSRDFFFDIPKEESKWICAVDGDGFGLLQTSDPILQGRKLFVWGQHEGGRHWNEWLSDKAGAYVEIQAGLLKTQLGHFIMSKKSEITWTECYSAISLNASVAHDSDYERAANGVKEVATKKAKALGSDAFDIASEGEFALYGSGWGALENQLRSEKISNKCVFPTDSINNEQADWAMLLSSGKLPIHDTMDEIPSYVVGKKWKDMLEKAEPTWFSLNHLGIVLYALGSYNEAKAAFDKSVALTPNCWAYRNKAMIEKNVEGKTSLAAENMLKAVALNPSYLPLVIECAYALMAGGREADFISLYPTLNDSIRSNGRVRMLLGACYVAVDSLDEAKKIITADLTVDDIKEGEYSLSAIWTDLYRKELAKQTGKNASEISDEEALKEYPLPYSLDFRMH